YGRPHLSAMTMFIHFLPYARHPKNHRIGILHAFSFCFLEDCSRIIRFKNLCGKGLHVSHKNIYKSGSCAMTQVRLSLLRGVCQTPAYVAHEKGFFREENIDSEIQIEPTAWMVPVKLQNGDSQFAVIPWTRVAAAGEKEIPLVLISGSGFE